MALLAWPSPGLDAAQGQRAGPLCPTLAGPPCNTRIDSPEPRKCNINREVSITRCRSECQSLRRRPLFRVSVAPEVLADIQAEFSREWQTPLRRCPARPRLAPPPDRRFSGECLGRQWLAPAARPYLPAVGPRHVAHGRCRPRSAKPNGATVCASRSCTWVDALSPSNFLALNPDAQQSIVESAGARFERRPGQSAGAT